MPVTINVDEGTLGMWCACFKDGNWLAHLTRSKDGRYELHYRFRWYRDELLEGSKDDRHFYRGVFKSCASDAQAISAAREVYELVQHMPLTQASWELLRGARSLEDFVALLATMPSIHIGTPQSIHREEQSA